MIQVDILEIRNQAERMLSVSLKDDQFARKLEQRLDQLDGTQK
jgi:hypothetical protein